MRLSLLLSSCLMFATSSSLLAQSDDLLANPRDTPGFGDAFDGGADAGIAETSNETESGLPQDPNQRQSNRSRDSQLPNPFHVRPRNAAGMMSAMAGADESDYDEMHSGGFGAMDDGSEGDMGMELGAGMGMGMEEGMGGMGMMGSGQQTPDDRFRAGLRRAITALKNAKSDKHREVLLGYVREAFENRYDKIVADRKKELERIKARVKQLESDLKRREAAKDRVVNIQLQSVQLAAEGLLELGGQ